jgi:hypothetical protein
METANIPVKSCMLKSQMKTMLSTSFSIKNVVHFEFIPQGQTVNQACYVEVPKQLHELCIEKA